MMILLKRKKKKTFFSLMFIIIIISIIFSILFIRFYSNKTVPVVIDYADGEIRRLVLLVINTSIGETSKIDTDDLFITRFNDKGEVILIDFDSKKSSIVLNGITNLIEHNLNDIEEGNVDKFRNYYSKKDFNLLQKGAIVEVPFGISFNSNFLNNLGPKIPVRISFTRNIETNFSTEVVEYGINNALLKLNINIRINVKVILPIISDNMDIDFTIPIAMKVIQGKIPIYYMDGFTTNSNIVKGND